MVRFIGLIISVSLQVIAAIIAWRLMKMTKYRLSWILISLGLGLLAIVRAMDIVEFLNKDIAYELTLVTDWISILISFLLIAGILLLREIFFSLRKAELERKRAEQRILNAIIDTEERERKRFAKELHDGLGPLLSTVKMSITALLKDEENKNRKEILKNAETLINESIGSIKEISDNISPHVLSNFGLTSALNSFVNKINLTKQVTITFHSNMPEKRFNINIETILYRAVCELITNTIRHASAKTIYISLTVYEKSLTLEYKDDGIGFDVDRVLNDPTQGMGYSNIKSRLKSINGLFILDSNPDNGTHALIKVNF